MNTVCFFGIYDPEYSRNRVLMRGFTESAWDVLECRVDPHIYKGFRKYVRLVKEWSRVESELRTKGREPDLVIVAFPGHSVMWLARMICNGKKIVFDAFLSRVDSNVCDRGAYSLFSPRGLLDWLLDWSSCLLAHNVLLDTHQHIDYFRHHFFVRRDKMIRIPVSTDPSLFYPRESPRQSSKFNVYFQGTFIPLQGLEYIVAAAEQLKNHTDIIFTILGSGQQFALISEEVRRRRLSNVSLIGRKPLVELPLYIATADLCLGIFGSTDKAERVIPNKVYEYIAMKKPVITADTAAIREFFVPNEDMILCRRAQGESLAEAILWLKDNPELRSQLAEHAYSRFDTQLRPCQIVSELIKNLTL